MMEKRAIRHSLFQGTFIAPGSSLELLYLVDFRYVVLHVYFSSLEAPCLYMYVMEVLWTSGYLRSTVTRSNGQILRLGSLPADSSKDWEYEETIPL